MIHRALVPAVLSLAVLMGAAAQEKPKSIKDVMAAHKAPKGEKSMAEKIATGEGSEADHKKLLELYEFLATQKPPQGDDASWKSKTSALIAAMKDVAEKKPGAGEALKKAYDCKACHSVHKPKK
jgi:hypothetical protein